jgi:hypothetical protein
MCGRDPYVLRADRKHLRPARNLAYELLHLRACQSVACPCVTDTHLGFDQQTCNRPSPTFSGENEEALGSDPVDPGGQRIMDLRLGPGRAFHPLAATGLDGSIQPGAISLGQPVAKRNQAPEHAA